MLEGKKTFIGIVAMLLSYFQVGEVISIDEVSMLIDAILLIGGTFLAVYGRLKAKRQYLG